MSEFIHDYLQSSLQEFQRYKQLSDKAIAQLSDEELFRVPDEESNSVAIIMKHIAGNAISRWTNFLTSDGEKPDRHRDQEFIVNPAKTSREELLAYWERGWKCVFDAVEPLTPEDFSKTVYIRGEAHTIVQAIQRQIGHYANHAGQIVYLAKHWKSKDWKTLSVPRGKSEEFNAKMSAKQKAS
jgi:hypothetical protein